jgi:hypothetical protein
LREKMTFAGNTRYKGVGWRNTPTHLAKLKTKEPFQQVPLNRTSTLAYAGGNNP